MTPLWRDSRRPALGGIGTAERPGVGFGAAWIAEACRIAGRSLNDDEWRDAFGDQPHRATCPDTG